MWSAKNVLPLAGSIYTAIHHALMLIVQFITSDLCRVQLCRQALCFSMASEMRLKTD